MSNLPSLDDTPELHPEWWSQPSWLLSASSQSYGDFLQLSGYQKFFAGWEGCLSSFDNPILKNGIWTYGSESLVTTGKWDCAELEYIDESMSDDQILSLVRLIAREDFNSAMEALQATVISPNANTELSVSGNLLGATDFLVPTLPSRRGDSSRKVDFATRTVRIVVGSKWHIAKWGAIHGNWNLKSVHWPHNAVPSRKPTFERGGFGFKGNQSHERFVPFMEDLCAHIKYQIGTFDTELEFWEEAFFKSLAQGASTFSDLHLQFQQEQLATLAEFMSKCRLAQRHLLRRPEIDGILKGNAAGKVASDTSSYLDSHISDSRERVRESFGLVASAAVGEQSLQMELQRTASQRLQGLVTVVASLLIVPSLVASVYGSNVSELSPGAKGTVPDLLSLMFASSISAALILRLVTRRSLIPGTQSRKTSILIGALVLDAGIFVLRVNHDLAGVTFVGLASGLSIAVVAAGLSLLNQSRRTAKN
jgi:hypothetical protein